MDPIINGLIADEHRRDLITSARNRRRRLIDDEVVPGRAHRSTRSTEHHHPVRHRSPRLVVAVQSWLAAGQL